ncbi:hypothetical protein [Nonomuraea guangzhouensis]|uniref:Uncharacterized protein n=1 Tax=Nonomuraea guangzhouensis TaxID=1291555 RepID=A0ABW4G7N5_9ACTN|nr:hypothetical protein [Nonomuraea guangzhouensis]
MAAVREVPGVWLDFLNVVGTTSRRSPLSVISSVPVSFSPSTPKGGRNDDRREGRDRAGSDSRGDAGRLDAAARKGNHGGRPAVITDDMIHTVLRRRAAGEPVDKIRKDLIIPTGKRRTGPNPVNLTGCRACVPTDN